ncbi:insecticyanin-A-like [Melitaea cinxia]|uniref:insecticyanin-A-like n=1 Tax=Melitaea cinxia TaxID=113334 RepID=UPI001E26F4B8|nr:insecticyanin-A-like [Melitaea cinxia]
MGHNLFFVLTLVLSVQMYCCQVLMFGTCADVVTMKYFEIERFLGKWYEIERFPISYEMSGKCAYKMIQQCGRRIGLKHVFINNGINYTLHVNSSYTPGDEAVFSMNENSIDPIGISLSIISTDYSNYALVYGCKVNEVLDLKYVVAWILSRNTTLEAEILERTRMELNSLPFGSIVYLESVDHQECSNHWSADIYAVDVTSANKDPENYLYFHFWVSLISSAKYLTSSYIPCDY